MLAVRLLGIPQVYTAHELLPWKTERITAGCFRSTAAWSTPSSFTMKTLSSDAGDTERQD